MIQSIAIHSFATNKATGNCNFPFAKQTKMFIMQNKYSEGIFLSDVTSLHYHYTVHGKCVK